MRKKSGPLLQKVTLNDSFLSPFLDSPSQVPHLKMLPVKNGTKAPLRSNSDKETFRKLLLKGVTRTGLKSVLKKFKTVDSTNCRIHKHLIWYVNEQRVRTYDEVRVQLMEMLSKMDSHFDLKDLKVVNIKVEMDFDTSGRFEFIYDTTTGMRPPEVMIRKLENSEIYDYQYTQDGLGDPVSELYNDRILCYRDYIHE